MDDEHAVLRRVWLCYQVCEAIPDPLAIVEANSGQCFYANASFQEWMGGSVEELQSTAVWSYEEELFSRDQWTTLVDRLDEEKEVQFETQEAPGPSNRGLFAHLARSEDGTRYVSLVFRSGPDSGGPSSAGVRDELTELANRNLIHDRIKQSLRALERSSRPFALLFIDLDDFKRVNDRYGHPVGDGVLQTVAHRLSGAIRPEDLAARYGGDEFLILIRELGASEEIATVVDRIVKTLKPPIEVQAHRITVSFSVGVRVVEDPDLELAELIHQADEAMYAAKSDPERTVRYFDSSLREHVRRRIELRESFPDALQSGQFTLMAQPVVDLSDGESVGAEILVRWNRGDEGVWDAGSFLPLFEGTGEILELDRWVLERVNQLRKRVGVAVDPESHRPMHTINVSRFSLMRDNLLNRVENLTNGSADSEVRTVVDLPGSIFREEEPDRLRDMLRTVSVPSVSFALDGVDPRTPVGVFEFGELEYIKIRRSIVQNLDTQSGRDFVRRVVRNAYGEDISLVAVGVETEEQFHTLRGLGFDYGQGFYFGRPQPFQELKEVSV